MKHSNAAPLARCRRPLAACVATVGLVAGLAWAPPALAADAPAPQVPAEAPAAPPFDMTAFAIRHGQLQLHQGFGLATLGVMATTAGLGWWLADGGGGSGVMDAHLLMAGLTTGLYLTTATLALTAPPRPLTEPEGPWDTVGLHRKLAWLHGAGMASTITLGLLTNYGSLKYSPWHAAAAYTTVGLMALSAGVIAFGD